MTAYEALVAAALDRLHPTTLERMHRDGTAMFAKHPVKVDVVPEERETREFNRCHNPEGEDGGQFCSTVTTALSKVRVIDHTGTGSAAHPDANYHAGRITVSDKFYKHPPDVREHIMLHELGHWYRDQFVSLADIMGYEEGEKFYNLFSAGNSEEGFADAFAVLASNPQELKDRYPTQYADLRAMVPEAVLDAARQFARKYRSGSLREFNTCHNPEGEGGGQFCATGGLEHLPPGFLEGSLIKQPLYHGSSKDVSRGLSPSMGDEYGIFLSPSRRYAGGYGETLHKALVNVQRPLIVEGKYEISPRDLTRADAARLQAQGYDAVVVSHNGELSGAQEVVIFDPAQAYLIKEAAIREFNQCHEPGGQPSGGRFCSEPTTASSTPHKDAYARRDAISGRLIAAPGSDIDAVATLLGVDADTVAHAMTQYLDEDITTVKVHSAIATAPRHVLDPESEEAQDAYATYQATAEETARRQHREEAGRVHAARAQIVDGVLAQTMRTVLSDHWQEKQGQASLPGMTPPVLTADKAAEILMRHGIITADEIHAYLLGESNEQPFLWTEVRDRMRDPDDAAAMAAVRELARFAPRVPGRIGYQPEDLQPGVDVLMADVPSSTPEGAYDPDTFSFDPETDIDTFDDWYYGAFGQWPSDYAGTDADGKAMGQVALEFFGSKQSYIKRSFERNEQGLTVHHDYFENKGADGQGKALMRGQMELYEELGVDRIETHANISTGAYAWARYGFTAMDPETMRLRVLDHLDSMHSGARDALRPYHTQIVDLLDRHRDDPKLPWILADLRIEGQPTDVGPMAAGFRLVGNRHAFGDMTVSGVARWNEGLKKDAARGIFNLGKALLTGTKWEAAFDMADEAQRARLRDYVGDWTE